MDNWSVAGYNAGALANKIYSDMGPRSIDRGAAEAIMAAALSRLAAESKLQLSAANAYAFPYADTITDVPLYTSGYLIETCQVPFYSMVMLNQDADLRGLTGPRKEGDTHVLQMSGEELRGYMEVLESKNSLMEAETLELAKAFEQIAGEFDKRKAVYGKEGL